MKLDNTYIFLEETEVKLIKEMQNLLTKGKRNASYSLYNSFEGEVIRSPKGFIFKINYAKHGGFVLDDKRKFKKKGPSKAAIDSISRWILNKGIAIGKGKIRTPLKKESSKTGLQPASKAYSKNKERKNFAFAIWYANKKRGRTWAKKVNFMKPYENLFKSKNFSRDLQRNLLKDGLVFIGKDLKEMEIKIKM